MEIKDILKNRRLELGMTMKELAAKCNVSEGTISRWESGAISDMRRDKIMLLANALQISPGVIMGWEEGESKPAFENVNRIKKKVFPLFDGIAAGKPIIMPDGIECYVDATTEIKADFAIRVHGDSMIGARINDGDIVFIRSQPNVENGEIAAVAIDNEATLKMVYYNKESNIVTLIAENPKYSPMIFTTDSGKELRILGKAIAFQSDIK